MNKEKLILRLRDITTYCKNSDAQKFKAKEMIEQIIKDWYCDW